MVRFQPGPKPGNPQPLLILSGSIWEHLKIEVWLFRVAELFRYDFRTIVRFADVGGEDSLVLRMRKYLGNHRPMQLEQSPHFFLQNIRKSLIYQLLLMPTVSTRWVWMWLTSIKPIFDIQLISRWNWYPLNYYILDTALISIFIIYGHVPAHKECTVEHFDFWLFNVHDLQQAGSPFTM